MENSDSSEFFDERQKMLERQATEAQPVDAPMEIPVPATQQAPVWTRESLLDFIRQHSV